MWKSPQFAWEKNKPKGTIWRRGLHVTLAWSWQLAPRDKIQLYDWPGQMGREQSPEGMNRKAHSLSMMLPLFLSTIFCRNGRHPADGVLILGQTPEVLSSHLLNLSHTDGMDLPVDLV